MISVTPPHRVVTVILTALLVLGALAVPAGAGPREASGSDKMPEAIGPGETDWRLLVTRAAQAVEDLSYTGESLSITNTEGGASVSTFLVHSAGDGHISVVDTQQYAVHLGPQGGNLADHQRNWFFPLPATAPRGQGLNPLEDKYSVTVLDTERLLNRSTTPLEITRRSDGELVERLWLDDESGLLLRRESYGPDELLQRMVAYLKLDLQPDGRLDPEGASRSRGEPVETPAPDRMRIDRAGQEAMRAGGWFIPDELPGAYVKRGAFAVTAENSQPLQLTYSDGLYTVSLFQQRGSLDATSLPPGAELTQEFGFSAYTWPDAVPRRVVWEAAGTTWSVVGDAPVADYAAIVSNLPQPEVVEDPLSARLARGLGRLWSWVSPWS